MKTITRISITEAIYEEIGLSRKDSGDILDMILDEIRDELVSGQDVKFLRLAHSACVRKTLVSVVILKPVKKPKLHQEQLFLSNLRKF